MCTVSWLHSPNGYHLLCNRDEKRTRSSAIAPRISVNGAVQFIAPLDQDFGGTWIATNEFGTSICLLNGNGLRPRTSSLVLSKGYGDCKDKANSDGE